MLFVRDNCYDLDKLTIEEVKKLGLSKRQIAIAQGAKVYPLEYRNRKRTVTEIVTAVSSIKHPKERILMINLLERTFKLQQEFNEDL